MRAQRELRRAHVQEACERSLHGAQHPTHQGNGVGTSLSSSLYFSQVYSLYKEIRGNYDGSTESIYNKNICKLPLYI